MQKETTTTRRKTTATAATTTTTTTTTTAEGIKIRQGGLHFNKGARARQQSYLTQSETIALEPRKLERERESEREQARECVRERA